MNYLLRYNDKTYKNILKKFEEYFNSTWADCIVTESLNYIYINKKQRSNSYLENYNRRIREKFGPFLIKRGKKYYTLAFIFNIYYK